MWDAIPISRIEREDVVFGLRMMDGVVLSSLSGMLHSDEEWNRGIQCMQEKGFLKITNGHLRLTPLGIRHADTVAVALL